MKNKTYIGCSGFSEKLWKGFFYPESLATKDYLRFYSEYLNSVEINSTFYRRPLQKTLENWYLQTNADFKFFIKIPKTITHFKKLSDTKTETAEFCTYIKTGLKDKLAGFLFQLPPSYVFNEENLGQVFNTIDQDFLNVVEFRHQSWWNEKVFEALKKKNIIFSGVSFPKNIADDFIINNEKYCYYRLHGDPILFKSEYSEDFLKALAKKIENFKGTSFVFFNNTFGTAGIKNALFLEKILKK